MGSSPKENTQASEGDKQALYYPKDSFEYDYLKVNIDLDAVKPELDEIHRNIRYSGFQVLLGKVSAGFNQISSQQEFIDSNTQKSFCSIVANAVSKPVVIEYQDDMENGPHVVSALSEHEGKVEVEHYMLAGERKDFMSGKWLGLSPNLRPQYPASYSPDSALTFVALHEAEHMADTQSIMDKAGVEHEALSQAVDAIGAMDGYVMEVSADLAALAYYDTQSPRGGMQDLILNVRSMNAVTNAAINHSSDVDPEDVSHSTVYSIRHYQETGELIRQEPLAEAYHTLGGYLSNYIDEQVGGVPYFSDKALDEPLQDLAGKSLQTLMHNEHTRDIFSDADETPETTAKLRDLLRDTANELDVGFDHATILISNNPRFLMAGLEQGLQEGEFEGLTKDIAVDTIKSLKGLGYKPFHGTPEEHQEFIAENVIAQQMDTHERLIDRIIDSLRVENEPKVEATETIKVVEDSTLQCMPRPS